MSAEVTLFTRLQATDDAAAVTVAESIRALAGTVPFEQGNLDYRTYQSDHEPSVFYITERWATSEDADRHIRSVETDPASRRSAALIASLDTTRLIPVRPIAASDDERSPK